MTQINIGKIGEDHAANFLQQNGFTILERNWHFGSLELDIIALDGDFLVIVEVKTRAYQAPISPIEAVNKTKQRNLVNATNAYVRKYNRHEEIRFDIISVTHHNGEIIKTEHLKNAFYPEVKSR